MKEEAREFVQLLMAKFSSKAFRGRVNWPAAGPPAPGAPQAPESAPPPPDPWASERSILSFLQLHLRASTPSGGGATVFPFSGHVGTGRQRHSLKGYFDAGGTARFGRDESDVLRLKRAGRPDLLLGPLTLDTSTPEGLVTGSVSLDGDLESGAIEVRRALYTATHKVPLPCQRVPFHLLGSHALAFLAPAEPGPDDDPDETVYEGPAGVGRAQVLKSGLVTIAARLADGTPCTASSSLVDGDLVPFAAALHGGKGALAGSWKFDGADPASDLRGEDLLWHRPPGLGDGRYPEGWPQGKALHVIGCLLAPAALFNDNTAMLFPHPAASPGPVSLRFSGGGLPDADDTDADPATPWTVDAELDARHRVKVAPNQPLAVKSKIDTANGQFTGSLLPPGARRSGKFRAVALPKQSRALGHWLPQGPVPAGAVEITADPD